MTNTILLTLDEVYELSFRALLGSDTIAANAAPVADSVREAEAEGIHNVGLGYLPIYCEHTRCGKVDGQATAVVERVGEAAFRVDAAHGFSHLAFVAAEDDFVAAAKRAGVATLALSRSSSAGVVGWFNERLARAGLMSLAFANSSPAMAPWGGTRKFFGTNPMGFGLPRDGAPPIIVDQSSTATAMVNVRQAAARGEPIPDHWGLDASGQPTTDAAAALRGSMAPAGGHKGFGLALIVDVLAGGLTGSNFSYQSSLFGDNEGGPTDVGQLFVAFTPQMLAGDAFAARIEAWISAMTAEDGVRLPGARRHAERERRSREGVRIDAALHERLLGYCG